MKKETIKEVKDLSYWKLNAEEDYLKVPISVLKYISELETKQERMYSEEDMQTTWNSSEQNMRFKFSSSVYKNITFKKWFEQFKKKETWYNEEQTTERMNIIGQNGNDGTHYDNK